MSVYNIVSFAGLFILMVIAWLFSWNRRNVNFRLLFWGVLLQLLFALIVFIFPAGVKVFLLLNDLVMHVIEASTAGSRFLFGRLALPPGTKDAFGQESLGFFLAFQALPTIIFFSALMSLLYYIRVLPFLVRTFAKAFSRLMGISGGESLAVASNIFVGVESTLTIRPHLAEMTRSELGTVLTAGMATVASNVMAIYVFSLHDAFPTIAGHLISASILSAPAAIVMSKLIMPEDGSPLTLGMDVHPHYERESSVFEAIINGSNQGLKLVAGIAALLLAILGLVALVDSVLGGFSSLLSCCLPEGFSLSLAGIFGYIFYPFALIMGVPLNDAMTAAGILGERLIVTEVTSYQDLAAAIASGAIQSKRTILITSYALCGFAHLASLAIFIGGTAALAPSRVADLAKIGFRALMAATLATLMTGAVAGVFYIEGMQQGLF